MLKMAPHSRLIQLGCITILLASTACTQAPVQVVLRGQNTYGQSGVVKAPAPESHAANLYRSPAVNPPSYVDVQTASNMEPSSSSPNAHRDTTYQLAGVQPIGVSDLPPPEANTLKVTEKPKEEKVAADRAQPVNLWTREPHFSKTETASAGEKPASTPGILSHNVKAAPGTSYMWPVSSKKVVGAFGPKKGGRVNDGLDIASAEGEPVWAAADGEVVFVGDELKGYGNMVLVKHPDGKTTTYAHLSRATIDKYDRVKQGDIIGYVGSTGNVRDPQLYFAINDGKKPIDPEKYLSKNVAGL